VLEGRELTGRVGALGLDDGVREQLTVDGLARDELLDAPTRLLRHELTVRRVVFRRLRRLVL
jgi:hypothetical protein